MQINTNIFTKPNLNPGSLTSQQALVHARNSILNTKDAESFTSTLEPLLDLFTIGSKKCPEDSHEFNKIFEIVSHSLRNDPDGFIKILKFHRHIENGNGIKWLYYLCLIVLKIENCELYNQVLEWSWQYPKDFLTLCQFSNMYNYPKIITNYEIEFYAKQVFNIFKKLLTPSFTGEINPMFLKYMSYESGHWNNETKQIWIIIEELSSKDTDFITSIMFSEPLESNLGYELRSILQSSTNSVLFTNKIRRLIKKCFNEHVNLLDNLFKGIHKNGRHFGSFISEEGGEEKEEKEEKEIDLIYNQIKRSATLAYGRFEKTVKLYSESDSSENLVKSYISKGYLKYLESLNSGEAKIKTTGLDASQEVWQFFLSNTSFDQSIESKLIKLVDDLKSSLLKTSGTAIFKSLAEKFVLILDISGSMDGKPIQTGLLYMLLMTKVFSIKELYYFEFQLHILKLTDSDISGTMCNLVKKIYTNTKGRTNLEVVFTHFRTIGMKNKNAIIITDGDCDPSCGSNNPFHTAPKAETNMRYIVVNVKETKMNFPYLGLDPHVCYVTGNNPKTLNGLIKALVISLMESMPITPSLVLKCSLDLEELEHSFELGAFTKVFTLEEINRLFQIFHQRNHKF
jgi:hypothetical protein